MANYTNSGRNTYFDNLIVFISSLGTNKRKYYWQRNSSGSRHNEIYGNANGHNLQLLDNYLVNLISQSNQIPDTVALLEESMVLVHIKMVNKFSLSAGIMLEQLTLTIPTTLINIRLGATQQDTVKWLDVVSVEALPLTKSDGINLTLNSQEVWSFTYSNRSCIGI